MPWRRTDPVSERAKFVVAAQHGVWTMTELCERFGISRKTGYRWLVRYEAEGLAGLADRSRRPHSSPGATEAGVVAAVVRERRRHPHWGPKKLLARLRRLQPAGEWPARSTVGLILKREGLVAARRYRRRPVRRFGRPRGEPGEPNQVWTADYKGEFRLGNGRLCYPLTIADGYSRYLLRCAGCGSTRTAEAWPVFEGAFREYGLPARIRTDNGAPFGSVAIGGLSELAIWWLKLGIEVERIEAGHPEQNGRHERMHRTLKWEATRPAADNARGQQAVFDRFRQEYNEERPHESLDDRTPAELYEPSGRCLPKETRRLEYPGHFEQRQVRSDGSIRWRGQMVFVSSLLTGEAVGLDEVEKGNWSVYFGPVLLGRLHDGERRIDPGAPKCIASGPPRR